MSGSITNTTKEYLVYVANKAQLSLNKISAGYYTQKDYKKGNIKYLKVKITNTGSVTSKATKIKMWYPYTKKYSKIYSKLKKYTANGKLKALKPGKSTYVTLYFQIPKKYASLIKKLRIDYLKKVNVVSRSDMLYTIN